MIKFWHICKEICIRIVPFYHRDNNPPSSLSQAKRKTEPLPVSIKKITLQDGFVHAYTDGSCNFNKKLLGLGVVIPTNDPSSRIIFSKRFKPERDYNLSQFGTMRSEFMAATLALKNLPEGTNVHFYTDHPILRKVLKRHIAGHKLLWSPREQNKHSPEFIDMVNSLKEQLQTMGDIRVTRLNDNISRRMALAHKAAARGSGAKGIKRRPVKRLPHRGENTFTLDDPRDSYDPRDSEKNTARKPNPLDKITFD